MFDLIDDFPPPFKSKKRSIGGYGLDPGHCFLFEVGEDGFKVTREFGSISAQSWFDELDFWPEEEFWTLENKRLDKIIHSISEKRVKDAEDIRNYILRFFGQKLSNFLATERETITKDLPELWKKYPDILEMEVRDGPIVCPKAAEPEFCALEIEFDTDEKVWNLRLLTTYSAPQYIDPEPTELECEYFDELIKRKEEVHLDWEESFIREKLIAADPRWEKFINAKQGED